MHYRAQVRLPGLALSATFATKAAARQWATQVEISIQRQHGTANPPSVTLGELVQRYHREVAGTAFLEIDSTLLPSADASAVATHSPLLTERNSSQTLPWPCFHWL